jgi:uncharacterized membrane protein
LNRRNPANVVNQPTQNPSTEPPTGRAGFADDFRRFFVRGVATLLPTLITILLLVKVWEILWDYLGRHIIFVLKWLSVRDDKPVGLVKWYWEHHLREWQVQLIGVTLAVVLVYIVGLFVGNILGRASWRLVEVGLMRVPLIRAIYPAVKQVTDFVLADHRPQFASSRVVAVQPHENAIWSVGLVTGSGVRSLAEATGQDMVTVFIPSSPTAFSGYVLIVPREKVVELPLTVEEAMRLLVTGGVSSPGEPHPAEQKLDLASLPLLGRLARSMDSGEAGRKAGG